MVTSAQFDYLPRGSVRFDFDDVFANAGVGAHRLAVHMTHSASWLVNQAEPTPTPALLIGTVEVEARGQRWLAGLEPRVLPLRGYSVSEQLLISTADEQLIALDHARGDGEFSLVLHLQLTLLGPSAEIYPIRDTQVSVRVPRGRWLELLDQLGSEVGILIRVASPLTDATATEAATADEQPSLSRTVARLRQARQQVRDHQWESAAATCRQVLDGVRALAGPDLPDATSLKSVDPKKRCSDQRWAALYYDTYSLGSAAAHDDPVTADFVWSRADAEAMLAMTAALLNHYLATE